MLKRVSAFSIAFLLLVPLLFFLAQSPQSPDGAEMYNAAVQGGVLHPSGMPLQGWINQAAVSLFPDLGVKALSLVSWLGLWLSAGLLLNLSVRLGAGWVSSVLGMLLYVYLPVVAMMGVIPEKYTLLSALIFLFLYMLLRFSEECSPRMIFALTLSFALAIGQHTAAAVLLIPYLIALVFYWMQPVSLKRVSVFVLSGVVGLGIVAGLYSSLLFQRGDAPWPDWGHLATLEDVFNHFVRIDYGVVGLSNSDNGNLEMLSGFGPLWRSFGALTLAVLLLPFGIWSLWKRKDIFSLSLAVGVLGVLILLSRTSMPLVSPDIVWGYQERYQLLLWPMLAPCFALGLSFLLSRPDINTRRRLMILLPLACAALFLIAKTFISLQGVNTKLVDLYREEAARELPSQSIFLTQSDFISFAGVPEQTGLRFPLKSMFAFPWYRNEAAVLIEPRLKKMMLDLGPEPWTTADLVRLAVKQGLTVASTEATAFLRHQDIMEVAEQRGLLWVFRKRNKGLYTDEIVHATLRACEVLPTLDAGLPLETQYFARELLESYKYAFMGASDYLTSLKASAPASEARRISELLIPGVSPLEWQSPCAEYSRLLRR